MTFKELQLNDQLLEAISYMGFETATPIQEQVIPVILENRDVLACAQTGTGKTGAFVLPVLNKLAGKRGAGIDTLIIVPTRELAIQIEQQIQGFSYFISASSIAIYGGGDGAGWETQRDSLIKGTDIVIATPGKFLSHLKMGYVNLSTVNHLILDEADRMLDMGFIDDIRAILSYLPKKHQTLMFCATMPNSIRQLARKILNKPTEVTLAISKPAEGVDQKAYSISEGDKVKLLKELMEERKHYDSIIIFSSTRKKVTEIVRSLKKYGFQPQGISSDLDQNSREEVLNDFRSKKTRILVATDVMSRGIDVKEINLVINFDVPHDAEDYVHRVGRTARINTTGEAITLVTPADASKLRMIERLTGIEIPKIQPAGYPVPVALKSGKSRYKRKTKNR
ncbi:MAG: DEAD/DEAH box helicase [Bacteroidales bacterium]|nr:DEAD/DEAH box helicase [Bacteroidales bacterium]